jgi:hypothetical protein
MDAEGDRSSGRPMLMHNELHNWLLFRDLRAKKKLTETDRAVFAERHSEIDFQFHKLFHRLRSRQLAPKSSAKECHNSCPATVNSLG